MKIDTSHINLLDHLPEMKLTGSEYKSACPVCGGNDRFSIKKSDLSRWYCRQHINHSASGDAITLLRERDQLSFVEACSALGIHLERRAPTFTYNRRVTSTAAPAIRTATTAAASNDQLWQQMARQFMGMSLHHITDQHPHSVAAMNYVMSRGLSVATIRHAQLGYQPATVNSTWGDVGVRLHQGIIIPWVYRRRVLRINVRRNSTPKYLPINGSETGLYNADAIYAGCDAVLVEGEFDALSIHDAQLRTEQRRYVAVASGSTTHARTAQWIALLATCKSVAIAYDADDAGEQASDWWLRVLPNAYRVRPLAHDVSDMYQSGMDVLGWLSGVIK